MSASAKTAVFNWLLTNLPARLTASNANGIVVDSWLERTSSPTAGSPILIVGGHSPDDDSVVEGDRDWKALGGQYHFEEFNVACSACCAVAAPGGYAAARAAAFAAFDVFVALYATDITIGGALGQGRVATIQNEHGRLMNIESGPNSFSTWFVYSFDLHCENEYLPT